MPSDSHRTLSQQLEAEGLCIVPQFLTAQMVRELKDIAESVRCISTYGDFNRDKHTGVVTDIADLPALAPMIAKPQLYNLLRQLGFADPKWFMGFVIQKPPGCGRLYWHQDWWGWTHPVSYAPPPPLVFFMFYLQDVDRSNGCLRLLAGAIMPNGKTGSSAKQRAGSEIFSAHCWRACEAVSTRTSKPPTPTASALCASACRRAHP